MTNELKQRLVGAAIITAIAAIFLPMLFDDPVRESGKVASELVIPNAPQVGAPDAMPATVPQLAYPSELAPESDPAPSDKALDKSGADENNSVTLTATNDEQVGGQKAAVRMTVAELAALKDKKEREKILKDRLTVEAPPLSGITEKSFADNKPKGRIDIEAKIKERIEADKRPKEKLEADRKSKEKWVADNKAQEKLDADKKAKAKLDDDKQSAEKIAKEKLGYQKLAAKKMQEKTLADKKAAEKIVQDTKLAAKQQAQDDKAAAAKIAADKLAAQKAVSSTSVSVRWFIRVGSFGQEANANTLRDALRKQGYPAVVDVVKSAGKGKLFRLRVGPELSRPHAEKIRQKMDAGNGSKSILEIE